MGRFVLCYSYYGRVRMKKSALFHRETSNDNKDEGVGERVCINSRDNLFKDGINADFTKFDYKPHEQFL